MLGFVAKGQGPTNPEQGKVKWRWQTWQPREHDTCWSTLETREHFNRPGLGACAGLFIAKEQGSYYNIITALNYLPANRLHSQGRNLDYYIMWLLFSNPIECHHVWMPMRRPSPNWQCVAFGCISVRALPHQSLGAFTQGPLTPFLPCKKHMGIVARWTKAMLMSFTCLWPVSHGSISVPFHVTLSAHPQQRQLRRELLRDLKPILESQGIQFPNIARVMSEEVRRSSLALQQRLLSLQNQLIRF
jgi:hypothetical protein